MKVKSFLLPAVALGVLLSISSAFAQVDRSEKADIPFDFYAGSQHMPAGTYNIGIDAENDIIAISDNSGKHTVLLVGSPNDAANNNDSELVFDHSGDSYSLRQVDSDAINLAFSQNKAKKAEATQTAQVHVTMNHS